MPIVMSLVRENSYRDSILLMAISTQTARECGVAAVSAMMATDRNKELFTTSGLMTPEIAAAKANDLAIAIKGEAEATKQAAAMVLRLLDTGLTPRPGGENGRSEEPKTIPAAKKTVPGLNLSLIAVAGDYARYEASLALAEGMDVMLYSDNISLSDELALKKLARRKGLLVMGPDCGTAIVDGTPLAFANRVARGPVGIVAASGTGLQEVSCLLHRLGVGINHAYGVGGRDLTDEIGGLSAFAAIGRLAGDPATKALVILGKPPGRETRQRILERCRAFDRPVFVHYAGISDYAAEIAAGLHPARDMTDLAEMAARHFRPGVILDEVADVRGPPVSIRTGYVCGIFGGGTLCQEAAEICGGLLSGPKASNLKIEGFTRISGKDRFSGHVFLDLGDDEFTVGRPHPMMAPDLKMDRLVETLLNPEAAVVLMDMVIGYGSHSEQAQLTAAALERAKRESGGTSAGKLVVASVCGVEEDKPSRSSQVDILKKAGVMVLPSNALAARWAARTVIPKPL
ncbi:MAG: hypothetical protein FWG74_02330 [Planctomycetes bacterium]|nr:hypothetical protein [Planctomycetota bacterium]